MSDGVDIKELLGAYLAGDLRPEERAATERLLAEDPSTRAVLDNLREVQGTLKQGQRPVSANLSKQLRERLAQLLADDATAAALGAVLAGEASAADREILKRFLRDHPQCRSEIKLMRATATWTAARQPQAGEGLSQALRERLAAKLPAHVRLPGARSATSTIVAKLPEHIRPLSQSLRVVAPESAWSNRWLWSAAAAAAVVLLAFGLSRIFHKDESDTILVKVPDSGAKKVLPEDQSPPRRNAPHENAVVGNQPEEFKLIPPLPEKDGVPELPQANIAAGPGNTPPLNNSAPGEKPPPVPNPLDTNPTVPDQHEVVKGPKTTVPLSPLPRNNNTEVVETDEQKNSNKTVESADPNSLLKNQPGEQVAVRTGVPQAIVPPAPPETPRTGSNSTGTGGGTFGPMNNTPDATVASNDPKNTNPNVNAAANDPQKTATAEKDMMTVAAVKGGTVEARPEAGAVQQVSSNQVGTQLATGTEFITTGTSRIELNLPDGTFWLNVNSRVKIRTSGSSTTVELYAGQFAYEASRGSARLVAENDEVLNTGKNIDARKGNGNVIVAVLGETAKVRGKRVDHGQQVTVKYNSDETPKTEPVETNATKWREEFNAQRTTTAESVRDKPKKAKRG
jgi:anti-sigma factor RsiW